MNYNLFTLGGQVKLSAGACLDAMCFRSFFDKYSCKQEARIASSNFNKGDILNYFILLELVSKSFPSFFKFKSQSHSVCINYDELDFNNAHTNDFRLRAYSFGTFSFQ